MDRRELDDGRRTGSVKAAINMYGERILSGSPALKKPQMDFPEKSSSRTRELHVARRDASRYKESRSTAESLKAQAESELSSAKETVKEISLLIVESSSNTKARMRDIEMLRKSARREEWSMAGRKSESYQYAEVMRELEFVKQELSNLKLEMASVLEEKEQAEKEIESSSLKIRSNVSSVEALRNEIDAANEEQVLVELARIEALKEYEEIEAQREKESSEFSFVIEETKKKVKDSIEEIDNSEELENKLAVTLCDVNVLQNELNFVKEMGKRVQRNDSFKRSEDSFQRGEELEGSPLLRSITEELEAAKKELASIKEEGFQFMTSMDIIRNELTHVREETDRLKKTEEKADLKVKSLNSKLLRAKSKLEAVSAAEEKARSMATNLSLTFEQLKTEAEAAKTEKALIGEETAVIKAEIQKTESEMDLTEERLRATMPELEAVKLSEASALEKLKSLIENTMQVRASASQHSSMIIISKFEHDYLTGRAVQAEEIADKKVAAAQAWVEALKASEKEITMKTEMAHRETRETKVDEVQQAYKTDRYPSVKRMMEEELQNWRQKREKSKEAERLPRKSMRGNGNLTPSRRAKFRKSASPATRVTPSTYFTIKKKRKVMPNLAKLFSGKSQDDGCRYQQY